MLKLPKISLTSVDTQFADTSCTYDDDDFQPLSVLNIRVAVLQSECQCGVYNSQETQ